MTNRGGKLFFHINGIKFHDLHDFATDTRANSTIDCGHHLMPVRQRFQAKKQPNTKTGTLVEVNNNLVALFRYGRKVYAIAEKCPHAGGPLHTGDIEDLPDRSLCVRCPYHGFKFDLATGTCKHPGPRPDLKAAVYPVKINHSNGNLQVGFEEFNSSYFTTQMF